MTEPSAVTVEEIESYLATCGMEVSSFGVETVEANRALCRWRYDESRTRPGGYISGPTIMGLVDLTAWVAVFTRAGITPMAVTWDLSITFMRPAKDRDLLADATVLRFGRMSLIDVLVFHPDARDEPCAKSTCTYAVPR